MSLVPLLNHYAFKHTYAIFVSKDSNGALTNHGSAASIESNSMISSGVFAFRAEKIEICFGSKNKKGLKHLRLQAL